MTPLKVEIVQLEPMRVASTYGFGTNPEEIAWKKMEEWASPRGLLERPYSHPIFGFNNPYPTPDHPRYGYEFWISVDPDMEPEGDVRIVEFFGGLYAVARCEVEGNPASAIPATWKNLADWCKANRHPLAHHPALERFFASPVDPEHLVLDLYCPIVS